MFPEDLKYTKTHEWAKIDGNEVTVGLTSFALEHLQDLVYLELPEEGSEFNQGDAFGQIESVKAVSDLNMPVSGKIIGVHSELVDDLETLKNDPYGDGWLIKVEAKDPTEFDSLLSPEEYKKHCEEEEA